MCKSVSIKLLSVKNIQQCWKVGVWFRVCWSLLQLLRNCYSSWKEADLVSCFYVLVVLVFTERKQLPKGSFRSDEIFCAHLLRLQAMVFSAVLILSHSVRCSLVFMWAEAELNHYGWCKDRLNDGCIKLYQFFFWSLCFFSCRRKKIKSLLGLPCNRSCLPISEECPEI